MLLPFNVHKLPLLDVYELPLFDVYELPLRARLRLRLCSRVRPRVRPRPRPRPRVVYPVFCSNADGSQRVDILTRIELARRPRRRSTVRGWGGVWARNGRALMQLQIT